MLLDPIGPDMAWPRHLRREVEPAQILHAALGRHQPAELAGHPLGDLAPGPTALIGRRLGEGGPQSLLLGFIQQRSSTWVVVPAVAQPRGAMIAGP